ncbi:MAG: tRNA lysidine(34) synthetase TilS [Candidatus Dadabacteria bacterium]|nr:tRNA lysidine(34) synthetase TilS [Candidatus Dadabacteria bacterium]NIS10024.1 tRNA lysidine(34) synthetase TilS [Candidatus Dadabacteria bacterium]NIV42030.1 tRNA lysidine(34) synthetase TilS [Candidatus Dadabacteria bacterium]NIX15240.1 tRNA lysidine(34) synthetase TilS [Candidatus Dadabacteria bacterium]NIY22996.1 tRNA lysidine(34) synthetase TilS [Candidatus Dadabacteria bacterium]
MSLLNKVRQTLTKHKLLSKNDTIIVGVSGGADSVFLLDALSQLQEYKPRIIAAHVNHCLRGKESDRDADFVKKVCNDRGLEFELLVENASAIKKELGKGIEESARIIRYRFFDVLAKKYNADKVATAHTADDQVETVFMRLIRGAGLRGLSGIPFCREPNIIRPLLEISKDEIKDYLNKKNINWVEDSSNAELDYFRNKVRHKLVPVLKELNPNITENVLRTSLQFSEKDSFISEHTTRLFEKIFKKTKSGFYTASLKKFSKVHRFIQFSLLREAITRVNNNLLNIDFDHIEAALELLSSKKISGEINLPNNLIVAKSYDDFIVTTKTAINPGYSYEIYDFGDYDFDHVSFSIKKTKAKKLDVGSDTALLNPKKVKFPIEVRNFRSGDKFTPFGMKGEKKLKDFFIDEKIPRYLRKLYPLFIINGEIAWIGGLRMSEIFRVKAKEAVIINCDLI